MISDNGIFERIEEQRLLFEEFYLSHEQRKQDDLLMVDGRYFYPVVNSLWEFWMECYLKNYAIVTECCGEPEQCWEPCGDLGHSEEHVGVSDLEVNL